MLLSQLWYGRYNAPYSTSFREELGVHGPKSFFRNEASWALGFEGSIQPFDLQTGKMCDRYQVVQTLRPSVQWVVQIIKLRVLFRKEKKMAWLMIHYSDR